MSRLLLDRDISIRDQWAYQNALQAVRDEWNGIVTQVQEEYPSNAADLKKIPKRAIEAPPPPVPITHDLDRTHDHDRDTTIIHVGIIGAGAAGLFAALVLDNLNSKLEMGENRAPVKFTYEIHEAAGPERVGGRLYSYNFGGSDDTHDYYDVGAMRFPQNPVMQRTFDLFARMDMDIVKNPKPDTPQGSLIPYYFNNGGPESPLNEPWCYNDITLWGRDYCDILDKTKSYDPFRIATDGSIDKEVLRCGPKAVFMDSIYELRKSLKEDLKSEPAGHAGWDLLMSYDKYSTRQYLGTNICPPLHKSDISPANAPAPPYNYATIEWLETFNSGTNSYDQAHSETVLDSLDFDYADEGEEPIKWYCVLGGTQLLAKRMEAKICHKPRFNSSVTAINAIDGGGVGLNIQGQQETIRYDAVLCTPTLGCLSRIDTRQANLGYPVKQAIRSLGYGGASKVAIKFKRAWWIHDLGKDFNIKRGGQGHSDLSLRTCVYPSYNLHDSPTKTAVLLCSYTRQQDSDRLGSLMSSNTNHSHKVVDENALKDLLLRDLARLHKNDQVSEDALYALIKECYLDHHAHDWYEDPNTAGAFGFFRPQQFTSMWGNIIRPSGDIIIAGEAASPHHAWVVGALESVIHGLHAWMGSKISTIPEIQYAIDILVKADDEDPFVGLPPYMDKRLSQWHSVLGWLSRDSLSQGVGKSERRRFLLNSMDFGAFHAYLAETPEDDNATSDD
ncbi:hypothetical protein FANTH_13781 [Fusarium anthophilum]|uniref:Amine oxidase domain-containing protein n=1 Tax=Fusarium anthophilum TaxID=48485 RepID=A0A8H4YLV3_9HYPO|nr:hypothetical protein FANTH_13781 [Fusarium anthophilum]